MNPKYYVSGKQAHHLRGLGHHLSPVAMLGKEGITENLLSQVEAVLAAHELIKVRIQDGCPYDRAEAAELLAEKTRSRIAQIIGKVFLLYRENKDLAAEKKIALPAKSGATTPANPKPASPRKPRTNAKAPACACKPEDKPA
ncbi:MAG: ribosome assembly RNA-binding protein YhbY, partial [Thermodesulfobacteriota bacterium]